MLPNPVETLRYEVTMEDLCAAQNCQVEQSPWIKIALIDLVTILSLIAFSLPILVILPLALAHGSGASGSEGLFTKSARQSLSQPSLVWEYFNQGVLKLFGFRFPPVFLGEHELELTTVGILDRAYGTEMLWKWEKIEKVETRSDFSMIYIEGAARIIIPGGIPVAIRRHFIATVNTHLAILHP